MGVTHFTLALCSYCTSRLRKRTAYLELHPRNEISQLNGGNSLPSPDGSDTMRPCFTLHGTDYYSCVNGREIPSLLNSGYDYLILDMGCLNEADCSEFLRCDCKFVLGSLAPWKLQYYRKFFLHFNHTVNLGEGFCYLVQTGNQGDISGFSKEHHISMQSVPFINNPFRIKKELFLFFDELLTVCRG